jgi:hypothetical protein
VSASFISSEIGTPFLPPVESSMTDRVLAEIGVIEDQGRADLADRSGAQALLARHLQDGFLVEVVSAELFVDFGEDRVDLDEGCDRAVGVVDRFAGVDRVGEGAGIAEVMSARHRRAVGHGEGRKQRVRVFEVDALVAQFRHGRRGLRRHDPAAQAVRDEQDQVSRRGVLGERRRCCGKGDQTSGQKQDGTSHFVSPSERSAALMPLHPFNFMR